MKKTLSVLLLGSIATLPILLLVAFSYLGSAHPLEQKKISDVSFLSDSYHQVEIVFFGYAGCPSICPTSLAKLVSVLNDLKQPYASEVGISFVDVSTKTQRISVQKYGQHFSDKIRGVNISQQELEKLTKLFAIRVTESSSNPDQLFHTDHFFILNKEQEQWNIVRVLAYKSAPSTISQVITSTLKQEH